MEIFLQPAGENAEEQLQITIKKKQNLEELKKYLSKEQYQELEKLYPNKEMNMWGVTFKRENVWNQMQIGDMILFYGIGKFFGKGMIQYKLHNQELAKDIWKVDADGLAWEYIYFMNEMQPIDIPIQEFNDVTGYRFKNVRGAMRVQKQGVKEKIMQAYQEIFHLNYQEVKKEEQRTVIQKLEDEIWKLDIKNAKKDYRIVIYQPKSQKEKKVNASKNRNKKQKERSTNLVEGLSKAAKYHIGILGEQHVYRLLKEKNSKLLKELKLLEKDIEVECYNKEYDGQTDWKDQSVNKGHDILVKRKETNEEIYLEIKTSLEDTKFYTMTGNELRFSKMKGHNYYIIKIDNFRYINDLNQKKIPTIEIIRNPYEIVKQGEQIKEISIYHSKDDFEDELKSYS